MQLNVNIGGSLGPTQVSQVGRVLKLSKVKVAGPDPAVHVIAIIELETVHLVSSG